VASRARSSRRSKLYSSWFPMQWERGGARDDQWGLWGETLSPATKTVQRAAAFGGDPLAATSWRTSRNGGRWNRIAMSVVTTCAGRGTVACAPGAGDGSAGASAAAVPRGDDRGAAALELRQEEGEGLVPLPVAPGWSSPKGTQPTGPTIRTGWRGNADRLGRDTRNGGMTTNGRDPRKSTGAGEGLTNAGH